MSANTTQSAIARGAEPKEIIDRRHPQLTYEQRVNVSNFCRSAEEQEKYLREKLGFSVSRDGSSGELLIWKSGDTAKYKVDQAAILPTWKEFKANPVGEAARTLIEASADLDDHSATAIRGTSFALTFLPKVTGLGTPAAMLITGGVETYLQGAGRVRGVTDEMDLKAIGGAALVGAVPRLGKSIGGALGKTGETGVKVAAAIEKTNPTIGTAASSMTADGIQQWSSSESWDPRQTARAGATGALLGLSLGRLTTLLTTKQGNVASSGVANAEGRAVAQGAANGGGNAAPSSSGTAASAQKVLKDSAGRVEAGAEKGSAHAGMNPSAKPAAAKAPTVTVDALKSELDVASQSAERARRRLEEVMRVEEAKDLQIINLKPGETLSGIRNGSVEVPARMRQRLGEIDGDDIERWYKTKMIPRQSVRAGAADRKLGNADLVNALDDIDVQKFTRAEREAWQTFKSAVEQEELARRQLAQVLPRAHFGPSASPQRGRGIGPIKNVLDDEISDSLNYRAGARSISITDSGSGTLSVQPGGHVSSQTQLSLTARADGTVLVSPGRPSLNGTSVKLPGSVAEVSAENGVVVPAGSRVNFGGVEITLPAPGAKGVGINPTESLLERLPMNQTVTLGRRGADVHIELPSADGISRMQGQLTRLADGRWRVSDGFRPSDVKFTVRPSEGAAYPLNGPTVLRPGDVVRIGEKGSITVPDPLKGVALRSAS